jgi:ERCC4-type nuclease
MGLHTTVGKSREPLEVCTRVAHLATGDYSILGLTDRVAVERKSLEDLFGTLGRGRDRFRDEFERLAEMDVAGVVIEASLSDIIKRPPEHSRVSPRAVVATVISWSQRWPSIHWWFADSRRLGEIFTFRILERYWNDQHRRSTKAARTAV